MNSRSMIVAAVVLVFAGTAANAQDSAEKDVRKAMEDNFASILHKDAAALNRQYTDDFFRVGESGQVSGKSEAIANLTEPDFVVTKLEPSDVKIRVYGNVAIVTELVTSVGGQKGKIPTEHVSRQTVVWVKQHDVWQSMSCRRVRPQYPNRLTSPAGQCTAVDDRRRDLAPPWPRWHG
ncbi:MAG TPA: nuclear transport factor 2 family protein [Candidatus Sulfotelmatobacter sp.]|jgi:ketosteroid isomerase-like protein|nr:nuclear transport factor 2 family protein [Candidatus Sulfotelmatobacter sp.]